ncbi:hypothetical protein EJB05_47935, partial [Eragrostis curvula]
MSNSKTLNMLLTNSSNTWLSGSKFRPRTPMGNEVAEVLDGGAMAMRVLGSESFFAWTIGTQEQFVDVQGKTEAMLLLVSVREDQRRIVGIRRFS